MFIFLVVEAIVFFIAFAYFDQVIPNEFGISKHPLWFCKKTAVVEDAFGRRSSTYDPNRKSNKRISKKYHKLTDEEEEGAGALSLEEKDLEKDLQHEFPPGRKATKKYAKFQESHINNSDK